MRLQDRGYPFTISRILWRPSADSITCAPCYRDGNLPLDVPYHVGHGVLRWNADAYVNMIQMQMPFFYLRFLLFGQLVKHIPKVPPQHPKHLLLPSVQDKNHMILAIPSCVS
jgi:hypothetical protein